MIHVTLLRFFLFSNCMTMIKSSYSLSIKRQHGQDKTWLMDVNWRPWFGCIDHFCAACDTIASQGIVHFLVLALGTFIYIHIVCSYILFYKHEYRYE